MGNPYKTFGRQFSAAALVFARERAGMSQLGLAHQLFDSSNCTYKIKAWEEGVKRPSPYTLLQLCKILGCTVDELAPKVDK